MNFQKDWKFYALALVFVGLIFGGAFATCSVANAADVTFAWVDPIERTDGEAFDADTELVTYNAVCSKQQDFSSTPVYDEIWNNAPGMTTMTIVRSWNGAAWCRLNCTDINGLTSAWSNTAKYTPAPPKAPSDFIRISRVGPRKTVRRTKMVEPEPQVIFLAWN